MSKFILYHMDWEGEDHLRLHQFLYGFEKYGRGKVQLDRSKYTEVAEVKCGTLEGLFETTNTIDYPWWHNPGVKILDKTREGFRSTSVTDAALEVEGVCKGRLWVCAPVGWLPAEWRE